MKKYLVGNSLNCLDEAIPLSAQKDICNIHIFFFEYTLYLDLIIN